MLSLAAQVLELLHEKKWIRVVRGNEIQRKLICPPGFQAVEGECVKITAQARRAASKAARKAARTRKGKSKAHAQRSRIQSLRKRRLSGL